MNAESTFSPAAAIWLRLLFVLLWVFGSVGCKPKIGEDCATSTDCSISGDRLCDETQPGGYCTVFNCEPNSCPVEAACVAFSEGTCSTAAASTRFRRTFCMRECEDESDCRDGYQCLDLSRDPSRRVVDSNAGKRICALASSNSAPPVIDPAVCFPSDASFDVTRPDTGPRPRDARETSAMDGADDRAEVNGRETGGADAADAPDDSNPVETGGDTVVDAADEGETGSDDAASEPVDGELDEASSPDGGDAVSPP
jgi:hypothetical protein